MSTETAGGRRLPKDVRVLWVVNVFDRLWDLRVQLKLLRKHFGNSIKIHVYCTGPLSIWPLEGEDYARCEFTDERQNGFRNAMRYVARIGMEYDIVVCSQAKTWCTDYQAVEDLLCDFWQAGDQFAYLEDGEEGAMRSGSRDSLYCDFFVIRGELSSCLWSPKNFQGQFPEVLIYERIQSAVKRPISIPHRGGRMVYPNSGEFIFHDFNDRKEVELLCGYASDVKWNWLRDRNEVYYRHVSHIHREWIESGRDPHSDPGLPHHPAVTVPAR